MFKKVNVKFLLVCLLAFMFVFGICASAGNTVPSANKESGSSEGSSGGAIGTKSTSGEGAVTYYSNPVYRMRAFYLNPDSTSLLNGDYDYFTVIGDAFYQNNTIYDAPGYTDIDGWYYFVDVTNSTADRDFVVYIGGNAKQVSFGTQTKGNAFHDKFAAVVGDHWGTSGDAFTSAFNNIDADAMGRLGVLFFGSGYTGDPYFIVIERMGVFNYSSWDGYTGKKYGTPAMVKVAQPYQDWLRDQSNGLGSSSVDYLTTTSPFFTEGSIAPFGLSSVGQKVESYSIYGPSGADFGKITTAPPSIVNLNSAAVNVAVEYQGDPGTNDSSQFKTAISFVDNTGDTSNKDVDLKTWSFYDLSSASWKTPSDIADVLRLDESGVIYEDNELYETVYADTYVMTPSASIAADAVTGVQMSHTVTWGYTAITGGDYNVGSTIKPNTIDGNTSTTGIANNYASSLGAGISRYASRTSELAGINNIDYDCLTTFLEASALSSPEACLGILQKNSDGTWSGTKALRGGGLGVGVGIEFIARGSEVTSYHKKVSVSVPISGARSVSGPSEIWHDTYTTLSYSSTTVEACTCFVVVPNSSASDSSVVNALTTGDVSTPAKTLNTLKAALGTSNVVAGDTTQFRTIATGSTSGSPAEGYTIYEIYVEIENGSVPVSLPSYMLNRYFPDVIYYTSKQVFDTATNSYAAATPTLIYLNNNIKTEIAGAYTDTITCENGVSNVYKNQASAHESWDVTYIDASSGTKTVSWDTGSLLGRYFISMVNNSTHASGVWNQAARSNLTGSGVSVNSKTVAGNSLRIDYGFNLIRMQANDKKAISGVRYASYDAGTSGDSLDMLKQASYFGTVLPSGVLTAPSLRNSFSSLGVFNETLTMTSKMTANSDGRIWTVSPSRHNSCDDPEDVFAYHDIVNDQDVYHTVHHWCSGYDYWTIKSAGVPTGYMKNSSAVNNWTYTFQTKVYKYSTEVMDEGRNDVLGSDDAASLSYLARYPSEGNVSDANSYRYANVQRNTGIDIKFLPDVAMAYLNGGITWESLTSLGDLSSSAATSSVGYKITYVLGEQSRTAESSSLYLFKMKGSGSDTDIKGTVYSDSMMGGSGILGNSKVTIPAGADVTVACDSDGTTLNLYGYALDLIDKSIDSGTFKTGASSTKAYTAVVANNDNVYTNWGNSSHHDQLKTNFADWCDNILDINNYQADYELWVDGNNKSENFSATIGGIYSGSVNLSAGGSVSQVQEDGVYDLVIEKGTLQIGKGSYSNLIAQIAADYDCSTSEAEELFRQSGLYTAIINAIEHCSSAYNNSGSCDVNANWTNALGGSGNWYDETTRTFVVRRYALTGLQFKDVIAEDKIDYQLAPSGSYSTQENINSGIGSNAHWKLNIFFAETDGVMNNLIGSGHTWYIPDGSAPILGGDGFSTALSSYTVIVNGANVGNADFTIPASSTQDFYN